MTVTFVIRKLFTPITGDSPYRISSHFIHPFSNVNIPNVRYGP